MPEILEPSLQLAAAVLSSMQMKPDEISDAIDSFRRLHLADLRLLSSDSGGSLGYGFNPNESVKASTDEAGARTVPDDVLIAKPI